MPHSFAQTAEITCSHCQTTWESEAWLIVDCAERPDLVERLRAGDLHTVTCPACGHSGAVDAPLLIYMPVECFRAGLEQPPLLLFSPAEATTAEKDREQAAGLEQALKAALGEAWREEWPEHLAWVPRSALPPILVDDPHRALGELQRELQEVQRAEQPPVVRALFAFLGASDEAAARQVFAQQHVLLQPYEAQRLLDEYFQSDDPGTQQLIAARRQLLRLVRGAAPTLKPTPPPSVPASAPSPDVAAYDNRGLQAETVVQGQEAYHQSAHAEAGGTATVTNITIHNVGSLPRQWLQPVPPPVPEGVVARGEEMEAVLAQLDRRAAVAIGGKVASVGMQGMPGVGKTTLALLVAHKLGARYPDGVLWTDVGPDVKTPADSQRLLNQWAGLCVGPLAPTELMRMQFDPAAVRGLLAEHARLLIVLDNVWSLAAVKPLRDAMPPGAQLLLTTRLPAVMDDLGGGVYALGVMTPDDALALVAEQLRWSPEADGDREWVDELIAGVGRHPLALSVALGILRREGHYPSERRDSAARVVASVRSGRNLDHLQLETADREHNVEAVLAISYDVLAPEDRRLLRSLGAFALEADFTTAQAALVWECEPEAARRHLVAFGNAALVTRVDEQTWRQHALLRGYCLAWLHAAGEYEQTAYRHAVAYNAAMREADDAQRYYQLLPGMAQLRHAFTWAVNADLDLALDLVANCANLMAAFGLAREQANWCTRVLETSRQPAASPRILREHKYRLATR